MKRIFSILALAALVLLPMASRAEVSQPAPAGTVLAVSGKVSLISSKSSSGKSLKPGQAVYAGDRIKTGANGKAQLVLSDGTQLKVSYLTDITLRDTDVHGKAGGRGIASIKIALGELWAKVTKKNSTLEFETPAAVAAVKGTEPDLTVDELGNLCIQLKEGKVDVSNPQGAALLSALQQICVTVGHAPGQPQPWNGQLKNNDNAPSSAVVTLQVKDKDGKTQPVQVQYEKSAQ